jgi:hypothetical protein
VTYAIEKFAIDPKFAQLEKEGFPADRVESLLEINEARIKALAFFKVLGDAGV